MKRQDVSLALLKVLWIAPIARHWRTRSIGEPRGHGNKATGQRDATGERSASPLPREFVLQTTSCALHFVDVRTGQDHHSIVLQTHRLRMVEIETPCWAAAASMVMSPVAMASLISEAVSADKADGLPKRWPRFLAAARPCFVRSRRMARSNSAKAAAMV